MKLPDGERLPGLRRDDNGPVFSEPWQAQAFAMTLLLCDKGVFAWREWTETLAAEIRANPALDDGHHYYHLWLAALQKIIARTGLVDEHERRRRECDWHRAALATPHGEPVVLSRASQDPETSPETSRKASGSTR